MADTKQAWSEVADRLGELGLKLKLHYEQTAEGREADGSVKKALEELRDAVDGAFDAVGNAVGDPAVKDDARDVASALRAALSTTFSEVSDDLRGCFRPKDRA
ncbi:MAG TPA: hypothetical protein VFI47_09880 [Acidimicrobiales bacterium]|nr:hypothetical protein [Acidimicrobiales bacterium]